MIRPGTWCDVFTLPGGRVGWARLDGRIVSAEHLDVDARGGAIAGPRIWTSDRQELWFMRADADARGHVCAVGVDRVMNRAFAICNGGEPVDLGHVETAFGVEVKGLTLGWIVYVQSGPETFTVTVLTEGGSISGNVEEFRMPRTSMGFLDGTLTSDAGRFGKGDLILPNQADGMWVGQNRTPNGIRLFDERTNTTQTLFLDRDPQPPHIAQAGDGSFFACGWRAAGAWVERVARPLVSDVVDPQPDPNPQPNPEPTPVTLTDRNKDIIEAFVERYGLPRIIPGDIEASKVIGREWVWQLAETMLFHFPSEGWGTKRASMSRPQSNESIARHADGRLWGWDLILGAAAAGQSLNINAHAEDISDQVFLVVEAEDHLTGSAGPAPNPNPNPGPGPTPTPVDLGPLHTKLDALLSRPVAGDVSELLRALTASVADVHARQASFAREHNDHFNALAARPIAPRCNFPRFGAAAAVEAGAESISRDQIFELLSVLLPLLQRFLEGEQTGS